MSGGKDGWLGLESHRPPPTRKPAPSLAENRWVGHVGDARTSDGRFGHVFDIESSTAVVKVYAERPRAFFGRVGNCRSDRGRRLYEQAARHASVAVNESFLSRPFSNFWTAEPNYPTPAMSRRGSRYSTTTIFAWPLRAAWSPFKR